MAGRKMTNSNGDLRGENRHPRNTNIAAQTCLCFKSQPVRGHKSRSSSSQTTDINSFRNKSLFFHVFFFFFHGATDASVITSELR